MEKCMPVEVVGAAIIHFIPDHWLRTMPYRAIFVITQRMVSATEVCYQSGILILFTGTIRLWQTTPGKTYGLWQGQTNGGYEWLVTYRANLYIIWTPLKLTTQNTKYCRIFRSQNTEWFSSVLEHNYSFWEVESIFNSMGWRPNRLLTEIRRPSFCG